MELAASGQATAATILPSGVVTFLFTDIVGSTRMWESEPQLMSAAMARHDELIEDAVAVAGGQLVRPRGEGDSRFAVFGSPRDALSSAAAVNLALQAETWATSVPVRVRIAVSSGEAEVRAGDYYGDVVNRCARLRGVAHPGQILTTAATASVVGTELPAGLSLIDLGQHRLKDLTRPEQVFQLVHAGLPGDFPALLSLDRAKHNLAVQTSTFVGREGEIAALREAVEQNRLVTLTGFGGMGKTRLALQVGAELADGSGGGVWFVDLSGVQDPGLVPARIAETLGLQRGAGDPADALVAALQDQPTLLILDNLEQILECASFVSALLAAAPALRILVTSREPLRLRGERQIPLHPMPLPGPEARPETLSSFDAVQLFLDRALSVKPEFAVTAANAVAVATICTRLDGHPLALELAAARMKMLSIESLLHRLQTGLQILSGGSRDMPERHRTLRATIAWSVDALDKDERDLLTAMSILPAPADFELIQALAGPDTDAFTVLDSLVEKSLVRTVDGEQTRYGLLVSIRDYAADLLTNDTRRTYQDRHADHLSHRLGELAEAFVEPDQVSFVGRELDQLRAAIVHRQAVGPAEAEVALLAGIDGFMVRIGHASEYLSISHHALTLAIQPDQRVLILAARMRAHSELGYSVDAAVRADLRVTAHRCTDPMNQCVGLLVVMATSQHPAEFSAAHQDLDDALRLLDGAQLVDCQLERDNIVAMIVRFADPPSAEDAARALLGSGTIYQDIGRVRLAAILLDAGRDSEALEVAAPLADPEMSLLDSPLWQTMALSVLAEATHAAGDVDAALALASRAFHREMDEDQTPYESAQILADIHRVRGELADAVSALIRADAQMPRPLNHIGAANLWRRAVLLRNLGRSEQGADDLAQAVDVLTAERFGGARDLLACAVETAVRVCDEQPAYAARLLGWVHANRRNWILPFGMDEEIPQLLTRLLPTWQADYDSERIGDPYPTG